jgi:hypothetical protein
VVDTGDHPGRDEALLAEDPKAGVDDDVLAAGLGGGIVDVADAAISGFDVVANEALRGEGWGRVC